MAIPSPYYFVPLEDAVWRPAGPVSHDVPFSDGITGVLDFEIEATRPIYIRSATKRPEDSLAKFAPNGNAGKDESDEFSKWSGFYRLGENGNYAIPGSSIRGMVRNVLKIATKGSMRETDDSSVALRDLRLHAYQKRMTNPYNHQAYEPTSKGGWLHEDEEGNWELVSCTYSRIEQEDIEAKINHPNALGKSHNSDGLNKKYSAVAGKGNPCLRTVAFQSEGGVRSHNEHSTNRPMLYDKVLGFEFGQTKANLPYEGTLVLTGQPSNRRPRQQAQGRTRGKHMEFVFHTPSHDEVVTNAPTVRPVSDDVIRKFHQTHTDGSEPTESWLFWKSKLKNGDWIPVFYLEDRGTITDLGLAQMFRLGGKLRLHDGLPPEHREVSPDFCDRLLGFSNGDTPLASRVSFESASSANAEPYGEALWTVLGSPKPSFYPNYLQQRSNNNDPDALGGDSFSTMLSEKIRLRGWKRYAVHPDADPDDNSPPEVPKIPEMPTPNGGTRPNYAVATAFTPLRPGAKFTGKIRLHNLRHHELGALLWVLTWGRREDLRHSLGMAKPLGFGAVRITLPNGLDQKFKDASGSDVSSVECIKSFVDKMNELEEGEWEESSTVTELLALADPTHGAGVARNGLLSYPRLVMRGENEFAQAKHPNGRMKLPDYTTRIGQKNVDVTRALCEPRSEDERMNSQLPPAPVEHEEIEIVAKRGKIRALTSKQEKLLVEGECGVGQRWLGYRKGGAADAVFILVKRIETL